MPVYEFRCNDCRRKVVLSYKTYAEYDAATHTCPRCRSTNLTRLISRVAIRRSPIARLMSDDADDSAFDDFDESDPRAMGRLLREMSEEMGEDMGPEFVGRLERGDSPEDIEASMPDLGADDLAGGPALGGADALGGDDDY